jgi:hypothetical protein
LEAVLDEGIEFLWSVLSINLNEIFFPNQADTAITVRGAEEGERRSSLLLELLENI